MEIWLILTIWMLLAAVFVLGLCGAAACPVPQPATAKVEGRNFTCSRIRHSLVPALSGLACLLLVSLLWAGCNTSRSYPGAIHGLSFDGTIQSIDLKSKQLTVAPLKQAAPVVFVWKSTTKFWKNDLPIHADAVEVGRTVRIHYHEESGRLVAHHVYVRAPYAHE